MLNSFQVFLLLLCSGLYSASINQELHINIDSLELFDNSKIVAKNFNVSSLFENNSEEIQLQLGDLLDLTIYNHDDIAHEFYINQIMENPVSIEAGSSTFISLEFNDTGLFIYHDPLDFPNNVFLGLAGLIEVKDINSSSFFWNIRESQKELADQANSGELIEWMEYYPEIFLVNGNSAPFINQDETARVTGNVGDTIRINIGNTGRSIHSLHFHGYHCKIIQDSRKEMNHGREKDTFAVYPMETIVLELVPHQSGEYPVHDHNLVATSGNGFYPNGMFLTLLISP